MRKLLGVLGLGAFLIVGCSGKQGCASSAKCSQDCNTECKKECTKESETACAKKCSGEKVAILGTFEGTFPCADCSGIKTTLRLNEDGTFTKTQEYLEKDNGIFETQGTYKFCEKSKYLALVSESKKEMFQLQEGKLFLVGADNKIAEDYRLVKESK